jgi:hypothetical protein
MRSDSCTRSPKSRARATRKVVVPGQVVVWLVVGRPIRVQMRCGSFLILRMVTAIWVWPVWRIRPIARLHSVIMMRGLELVRTRDASSQKVTSRTQWIL